MVDNRNNKRMIHAAIALLITLILIFSDSASAITVKVDTTNMDKTVGQKGYFFFNVTIGGNERIPIANFTIEGLPDISGSPDGILTFSVSDTTVGNSTQEGKYTIKLVKIYGWVEGGPSDSYGNATNYGYDNFFKGYGYGYDFSGYGYGYDLDTPGENYTQLAYKITVDTTGAAAGEYNDVIGKINTGVSSKPYFSTASTSSFTLTAESTDSSKSSGGSSKYTWTTPTTTAPVSTETEDTTQGQATPIKTEEGDVSTDDDQETQTPTTPTETEDDPGFTAIMFIAGLLAAAYIIIKKKG